MFKYYGKRSHMTSDLKRHAHAVRQVVDAKPATVDPVTGRKANPRLMRYVERVSQWDGKSPIAREAPRLAPRDRHTLAWRRL